MDGSTTLSIPIDGYFYSGSIEKWREFAAVLADGRIGHYRASINYGNQSLSGFFRYFQTIWKPGKPLPTPEDFGLIQLMPVTLTQSFIIDELLKA